MRRPYLHLPVLVLLFLSPLVGEIFLGATRVSRLASAFPLIFFYGGGAIIIRELARRHGPGWWRIVVLAVAYGIVEEGLATQSLFNPDLFNAGLIGGRSLGVNWVWSEWTVGYHVVYSIAIPILLANVVSYPERSALARLEGPGGRLCRLHPECVGDRHRVPADHRPEFSHAAAARRRGGFADRHPGGNGGLLARSSPPGTTPVAGIAGRTVTVAGRCVRVPCRLRLVRPARAPLTIENRITGADPPDRGYGRGCRDGWLIRRWSNRKEGWTPRHLLALVMGSLPPVILFGFFVAPGATGWIRSGEGVASVAAMVGLSLFFGRLSRGEKEESWTGVKDASLPVVKLVTGHYEVRDDGF